MTLAIVGFRDDIASVLLDEFALALTLKPMPRVAQPWDKSVLSRDVGDATALRLNRQIVH